MKKYSAYLFAFIALLLSACNNEKKEGTPGQSETNTAGQKNLETVHLINQAFETGDFSNIKPLLAADAVDHSGPSGDIKSPDSIVASMQQWAKMITGPKSSTIKEFADKDYVFQWMEVSGKMAVDGFGMKTGQAYNTSAIEVTRFNNDGKATEHWEFVTMADAAKMMGGGSSSEKK